MSKRKKILILAALLVVAALIARGPIVRWNRAHVDYITSSTGHSTECLSCHLVPQREGLMASFYKKDYLSPYNMTVTPDGKHLFVIAQQAGSLLQVDLQKNRVTGEIKTGKRPHSVVIDEQGKTAYVSNQWSDIISVIDIAQNRIIDTLYAGGGPAGMSISKDGGFLYIVNSYSSDISVIDLASKQEIRRLMAGNNPVAIDHSPDGQTALVSSRRILPDEFRAPVNTELTQLDGKAHKVADRKLIPAAHIMENVDFTPSGDLAFVTLVRPKNLVPSVQIESGWMMNQGLGVIIPGEEEKVAQLLLDEPNAFYPDPFDVVVSPNGKRAYVSHSGANVISVIDVDAVRSLLADATPEELVTYANHLGLSSQYVIKRIKTGANPKGLAVSPDGKKLYVAERFEDRIAVIDTKTLEISENILLGGPQKVTMVRRGAQLFHNADHTFHQQYSCYTCHPDGHEDGLTYDLTGTGRNFANVQTLRDLHQTSPFKWNGKNVSVYMQCGMRFSKFVTRTESFSSDNLNALVAYILRDLTHPPNYYQLPDGELTAAQQRGKELYYRTVDNFGDEIPIENRCNTCHPPPNFTNRKSADVGTLKDTDSPMLFDSPNLNNVYESAPYLHDGSAATLEEIWTRYNDHDQHGVANDMTKDQLNDLIEYLKCLGPAHTYQKSETKKAGL